MPGWQIALIAVGAALLAAALAVLADHALAAHRQDRPVGGLTVTKETQHAPVHGLPRGPEAAC
jgi:hypothetical protein